jgi:putative acetyltransferase
VLIRAEQDGDIAAIHALVVAAFGGDDEARLVDALRTSGGLLLSLVAELDTRVVGHIAFSAVTVSGEQGRAVGVGLAPMAVLPGYQRQGIGGALIREGLARLRADGQRFCAVLGHADYYPRHGFVRASLHGIRWERPVPEEVFFVQALQPDGLVGVSGSLRYHPEFDALGE